MYVQQIGFDGFPTLEFLIEIKVSLLVWADEPSVT